MLFYCILKTIFMEGEQPFEIVMKEAKFNVIVKMDTITGCEVEQNLVITDIALPLDYSAVKFDFTNIGSVLGAIVDTIGSVAISFSQDIIVDSIKKVVKEEVPGFLCNSLAFNSTKMDPVPVVAVKEKYE